MARTHAPAPSARAHSTPSPRAPEARSDAAVSPVVGMILVLAVSIVGISAVLYWGLPAIDQMKANVEQKSVDSQFKELAADVRELVAGTAGKTAKRWQPSMSRGQVQLEASTNQWVIVANKNVSGTKWYDFHVATDNAYEDAWFSVLHNGSHQLGGGLGSDFSVKAWDLVGSDETNLTVCPGSRSATSSCDVDGLTGRTTAWASGSSLEFWVVENASVSTEPLDLSNRTLRIEVWDDDILAAEIWVLDFGSLKYRLPTTGGHRGVILHNGAVLNEVDGTYTLSTAPPMPAPRTGTSVDRVFLRMIHVYGHVDFSGSARFSMLASLYDTTSRADYPCRDGVGETCVSSVRIYTYGDTADTFTRYLTATAGYDYVSLSEDWTDGDGNAYDTGFVQYPEDPQAIAFSFVHSMISMEGY